jgi:hypothetical protein
VEFVQIRDATEQGLGQSGGAAADLERFRSPKGAGNVRCSSSLSEATVRDYRNPHLSRRRIPHVTAGCFDLRIIQSGTESSRYFACDPENGSEWRMHLPKDNELQERIQLP